MYIKVCKQDRLRLAVKNAETISNPLKFRKVSKTMRRKNPNSLYAYEKKLTVHDTIKGT